jgi:hypothetical protein
MGMYTEVYVNVDLKEETPTGVIEVLRKICDGETPEGFPPRSGSLFRNCSYYTPRTSVAQLTYDEVSNAWSLLGKGDLKNYGEEAQFFFDWLIPWIKGKPGDFVGYTRYEEDQPPSLVFIPQSDSTI